MVLLSITHNTELLSLHFKQDQAGSRATLWIKCLSCAILEQLGSDNADTLFSESELSMFATATTKHRDVASLSLKLSELSQLLGLYPYNKKKKFTGTLQPISHSSIQPACLICPNSSVCLTEGCDHCFLKQNTPTKDIPRVTLIKGTEVFENVQLLSGFCSNCKTIYYADHERTAATKDTEAMQFSLNSAKYLKVGQKLWVDRKFSTAVMNGIYHLHASTSGWANYFNDTYGNDGRIQPAKDHACAECSQPYRATSDAILGVSNSNTAAQDSGQMRNVTMKVIDGMVYGTKVFFLNSDYDK